MKQFFSSEVLFWVCFGLVVFNALMAVSVKGTPAESWSEVFYWSGAISGVGALLHWQNLPDPE